MTRTVTKTVQIRRSAADSYAFIADPETMPQWAIHNVRSIRPLDGDRWEMQTPRGNAILVPHYEKRGGILDHAFVDVGEGVWNVSARIVPAGPSASVYMITLPKPDAMPMEAFDAGMALMDEELAALKACIESLPARPRTPVETVESLYEAFRRRDMPTIFELLSPDVEIVQSEALPWGGDYHGHDGARRFFAALGSNLRSTLTFDRLIDSGDHIVAIGRTEGTVNATGEPFRVPVAHVWHVRNGLVVRVQFYIDHPGMSKAL